MTTGAEIVDQLTASMESDSSTDKEQEAAEKSAAEAKGTQNADSSSTKGNEDKGKDSGKDSKSKSDLPDIPYDRFKQKVDQVAELTEKLEAVVGNAEGATARETELREKIEALEAEAAILDRVRALGENDKYRPIVEQLDAALRGIDEEVESGAKTEKEGEAEVTKLFREQKAELEDAFSNQRADLLLEQARGVSESILESLPDNYDESDKNTIAGMIPDLVDWAAIEDDPSVMRHEIVEGYKRAIGEHGEPRGALKARIVELETKQSEQPEAKEAAQSDDEFVEGLLSDERLGKYTVNDEGQPMEPEMSEAEFQANFAEVMRRVKGG
jgi:hypothetical protein